VSYELTGFSIGDTLISKIFTVTEGDMYNFGLKATSSYDTSLQTTSPSVFMNYDDIDDVENFDADQPDDMFYIELTWEDDNHSEDGYTIYRKTSSQSEYAEIASLGKNTYIFNDEYSNFEDGITYNYKVTVYNEAAGEEEDSFSSVTYDNGIENNLDFSLGDLTGWSTSDPAWLVVDKDDLDDPDYCAQSADLSDDESSSISLTKTFEGNNCSIFFEYWLSTEYYDHLVFYVDGVEKDRWSGISSGYSWPSTSYSVEPGTHTFRWSYEKDDIGSSEEDAVWIDNIELTGEE